jgi:hypothetical protein
MTFHAGYPLLIRPVCRFVQIECLGDTQRPSKIPIVTKFRFSKSAAAFAPDLLRDFHGKKQERYLPTAMMEKDPGSIGPRRGPRPGTGGVSEGGAGPYSAAISRTWPVFASSVMVFAPTMV